MNIYGPIFSSADMAKAAGMTPANFRQHLARGQWRIVGVQGAQAAKEIGKGHMFSIFDALGYALAHQLEKHGLASEAAFDRAFLDWAHFGNVDREPGNILPPEKYGATLYVYSPGAPFGDCVGSKAITDPILLLIPPDHQRASSAIIIHLNDLRDRVFRALDLDARDYE